MDNYKDLFIDLDNFNEDNISYVKPILFYKVTRNMGIYYKKETIKEIKSESKTDKEKKKSKKKTESDNLIIQKQIKKQKIIIQTPKMIVPFGIKEFDNNGKKSYQMCLSFSTMTNLYNEEEIKKFYLFIQKIDSVNEDTIMDYKSAWGLPKNLTYKKTLQRSSKEYPHYMNINLPRDDKLGFLFHIYDEKATKASIDIIEKKSIVSVVMELTDLKFTDTEFRSNWTVMQIRKFKPYSPIQEFFMSGCFIADEDDPEDAVYAQMIEKYKHTLQTPVSMHKNPFVGINHGMNMNPAYYQMPYMSNPYGMTNIHNIPHPPSNITTKPSVPPEAMISGFTPPSLQELLNAKKSLKSTKTIEKIAPMGKVINEDDDNKPNIPVPPPPPVSNDEKSIKKPINEKSKKNYSEEKIISESKSKEKINELSETKNTKDNKKSHSKKSQSKRSQSKKSQDDNNDDNDTDNESKISVIKNKSVKIPKLPSKPAPPKKNNKKVITLD